MAKTKSDILSKDGEHLALMYDGSGIVVDKTLLKYSSIKKEVEEYNKSKNGDFDSEMKLTTPFNTIDLADTFINSDEIKKLADRYEIIKDSEIHSLNVFVNKFVFDDIFSSFNEMFGSNVVFNDSGATKSLDGLEKPTFWKRLTDFFSFKSDEAKEEADGQYAIDVVRFFSDVKGLTKENKKAYVDRLVGYIVALKNCDITGQQALKEKLLRDMIVNKYESVLYANDLYYVITEDQIVDFVKKTEKGVRLTYIKNYMRALPTEVLEKLDAANKLEIFDNYAILHYDPDYSSYAETIEETKKRRDPILFGLIRGSNKLYYITDWIDEYCDLTLDKFVETLQIKKKDIKMEKKL